MTKEEFLNNFRSKAIKHIQYWIKRFGDDIHESGYWDRYIKEDGSQLKTSDWLKVLKEAKDIGTLVRILRDNCMDISQIIEMMLKANFPDVDDNYLGTIPLDYDT